MGVHDSNEWYAQREFDLQFPPTMIVGCGICNTTFEVRELKWDCKIQRLRCRNWPGCEGVGIGRGTDIGEVKYDHRADGEWSEYFDVGQEGDL